MMDFASLRHADDLNKYVVDVVSGKQIACEWVQLACKRHLSDLQRTDIYLDEIEVNRSCWFFEQLPHSKGKWAQRGEKLILQPWQKFIIGSTFGWKRRRDDLRRFREVVCVVPRKNGKSQLAAGVGLRALCDRGEAAPEIYCGATSQKQAMEVYRPAAEMLKRLPQLRKSFGLEVMASKLKRSDGGRLEAIIGKPGDGASPSCAIVDEYHEHASPELYETMQTGMGAREEPLLFTITTAGTNMSCPCYELQQRSQEMLQGTINDDQLFAVIYGIDKEDSWADPKVLAKANPNLGVSVFEDFLITQQQKAINSAGFASTFKTKHLNVWVNARDAFFNLEKWQQLAEPITMDQLKGKPCWIGLDLATKSDLCAAVFVFPEWRGLKRHYTVFSHFWAPEALVYGDMASQALKRKLQRFAQLKQMTVHDGAEVCLRALAQELQIMACGHSIEEFDFDPWGAYQITRDLAEAGWRPVKIPQNVSRLSPAMKELDAAILSERITHSGCQILDWCLGNVTAKADANENVFPRKEKPEAKIDGAAALLNAISRAMLGEPSAPEMVVIDL